jgi:hypothetical protein
MAGRSRLRASGRHWISAVIVIAVLVGGFAINRLYGAFGSDSARHSAQGSADHIASTNPKHVSYQVFGPSDTRGIVSYLDEYAQPRQTSFQTLPWTFSITTTLPSVLANIVAQGDGPHLGCRIVVNDVIRDMEVSDDHNAMTFCLVKAA